LAEGDITGYGGNFLPVAVDRTNTAAFVEFSIPSQFSGKEREASFTDSRVWSYLLAYHVDPAASEETDEVQRIQYPIPIEIAGRSVLVLKDVVSSGVTEPYLEQQLRDHGAAQVRFAALIDLPDERKTAFDLPYSALTTNRRGVLVGYGLKADGLYGNLSYVGRLPDAEG